MEEDTDQYYLRVSERLRHKQRAVASWDFERLILEQFPEIFRAKCYNHTNTYGFYQPGKIYVKLIPNPLQVHSSNKFLPKLSGGTLERIERFLENIMTPGVELQVRNPKYEIIEIKVEVGFHKEFDAQYYATEIKYDIKRFISPWAFLEDEEIIFLAELDKSTIIAFIEQLESVNYVKNLQIFKTKDGDPESRIEIIGDKVEASDSLHALVSADEHFVTPSFITE